MGSHRGLLFCLLVATLALLQASAKQACYASDPHKPDAVLTWGTEGKFDTWPGTSGDLSGWHAVNAITGETLEQTRQEALAWYRERYGFDTTVLAYDPSTGIAVLPQGYMLPTTLTVAGYYHLWSETPANVVGQECPSLSVIEWVLFTLPTVAGTAYNGTYGDWYRIRNPLGSPVSANDVFSIGRYLITGANGDTMVLPFKTWFPVRLDAEHTYRVDNIISHPTLGVGFGQSNYRFYTVANSNKTWVQLRNTIKFPFVDIPPISPTSA